MAHPVPPSPQSPLSTAFHARELGALRNRVARAVETFKNGGMILVGDDGRRENEADLVFHASHATPQAVNFAITHARGLLCVSVGHALADALAFHTAPRLPGNVAHTGFTLSVDAREDITSGISASDRAHTIRLMAAPTATSSDFISPGHVFPVRANSGGLLSRSGHTEALLELCTLANLPPAAAMCEVLAEDGEALRPGAIQKPTEASSAQAEALRALPYLSTVDLLWYRVFYGATPDAQWVESSEVPRGERNARAKAWVLAPGLEEHICLPGVLLERGEFVPETLRISLTNGLTTIDNGVPADTCSAHLSLYSLQDFTQRLDGPVSEFCDLSAKEGIQGTKVAVKRIVTQLRALEFLQRRLLDTGAHASAPASLTELVGRIKLPLPEDGEFLKSLLTL